MNTRQHGPHLGRIARAADLIAALDEQLSPTHPARGTVLELQRLFGVNHDDIRSLLERVPGKSLAAKADLIGISRQALWSIWRGLYKPNQEVMAAIRDAAEENVDGK